MAGSARRSPVPWLIAGIGLLSLGAVLYYGLQGRSVIREFSAVLIAPQALIGGGALIRRGLTGGRAARFRLLLGSGLLVIAVGAVVSTVTMSMGMPYPSPGDYLQPMAIPLLLAGLAFVPRRSFERFYGLRLTLEALMIGIVGSLLYWRVAEAAQPSLVSDPARVLLITVHLIIIAVVCLAVLGSNNRGMLVAAVGGVGVSSPDLVNSMLGGSGAHLAGDAALAISWPVLTIGLLMINAHPEEISERAEIRWESRRYVIVSATFLLLSLLAIVSFVSQRTVDSISLMLGILAMVAAGLRELLRAAQLQSLLKQLGTLAHEDHLTGLSNRRALEEELLLTAQRPGPVSVLILDIDGFKSVNEQLGHEEGDRVLTNVARIIAHETAQVGAQAFRVGGDEFVVVSRLGRIVTDTLARQILDGAKLAALGSAAHARVTMSVSIGMVHRVLDVPSELEDVLPMLSYAGIAMRKAKRSGSNHLVVYDEVLEATSRRRLQIEQALAVAVAADRVDIAYQPIQSLATGDLIAVEALARWSDDELGEVPPTEFIQVAEERGLIHDLGDQILRRALRAAVATGLVERGLSVSVNVSVLQLRARDYVDKVAAALRDTGVPPGQLTIEVTESVFIRPDDLGAIALNRLAALGISLSLDDFGTGYSSIGYLSRLPVRALKIDRSLTCQLADGSVWAITRSIVEMASALGLSVVVEGVETGADEQGARLLGADHAQGWLYGIHQGEAGLRRLLEGESVGQGGCG